MDLSHVLFGTVLGLDDASLLLVTLCASITLIVLALIFRPLVIECLDPGFLLAQRGGGSFSHMVFLVLLVMMLVAGFQVLRSEEQTSELQSLMRSSYAVFCLKKKNK